ncbi:MFS transporter [Allorhizocola rhizosphaerae]|uniref:MFS transporter n=1 Tax=Allorhizocola rhizosphaerae TaxID=1872709 RepID=UPI000E3ECF96|nr:MFS transporter [Allorhizocola rhizosphaerae]
MTTKTKQWLGFFAILAATLMNILDSTIVNVAAPAISLDLGAGESDLQWIAAAYTLALATGLLTGGRLGDMFGRRRILLIGIVGFVAASMACAMAWSPESLIAARVVQGLFGAVMIPQAFGLIRDLFPPQEIGKAFAVFGPVIGLSTILGPVVAGLLVQADVLGTGWRMVFGINLPLGLFALLVGMRTLPRTSATSPGRLDVIGALFAGTGMVLVIFPLIQGRELGWPIWTWGVLAAAVLILFFFIRYQLSRKRSGRSTIVELSVLSRRSYTSGVAFVLVFFGGIVGFGLAVGLYLQLGLGQSPIRASLTMTSWAIGAFIGSAFAAAMMAKLGRRILHIGLALMGVSLIWLYEVIGSGSMFLPLVVYGTGMGMVFVPVFDIIMGEVADREMGSAASLLESVQQLGASLGIAVLGTIYFAVSKVDLPLAASKQVTLASLALTAAAFALVFLLPQKARAAHPLPEPAAA